MRFITSTIIADKKFLLAIRSRSRTRSIGFVICSPFPRPILQPGDGHPYCDACHNGPGPTSIDEAQPADIVRSSQGRATHADATETVGLVPKRNSIYRCEAGIRARKIVRRRRESR